MKKTYLNPAVIISAFIAVLIILPTTGTSAASPLGKLLENAMQGGNYSTPSIEEVTQAEQLFFTLLTEQQGQENAWEKLGWEYLPMDLDGKQAVVLREAEEQKRGRGFFVFFRSEGFSEQALMIPHGFKDLLTDEIGVALISEGNFRCAAFNTRPRRIEQDEELIEQDLAHEPISYFTALTKAFALYSPHGHILQLHGYAQEKRQTEAGKTSDFILSSGTEDAHQDVRSLSSCLNRTFKMQALVYPDQVEELGATTNISGKILRAMKHDGFVHLEMNRSVREQLSTTERDRKKFLRCTELN